MRVYVIVSFLLSACISNTEHLMPHAIEDSRNVPETQCKWSESDITLEGSQ